ncbi:M1 family metallopeptidase [Acidothermaceae bacterium B102]|nr:M1 family metallopeptidase [Acidothermaceae bacterium B102]
MSIMVVATAAVLASTTGIAAAQPGSWQPGRQCSSGARTLSHLGDHVYPETGNGGYRSVHTDVHLVYDAPTNLFLAGNHVDLTDVATQCLSDFSLDFQRTSAAGADGPDLTVQGVTVNGRPVAYRFVQPTYPDDPNGVNDPDPRAHEAGQQTPVGGPDNNPLPPACEPELTSDDPDGQDGEQCPANKLVITPSRPLRAGEPFVVSVSYTGRPGVHVDGDGSTEGWFRSDSPPGDGGFVTTEPVGSEAWMPLNDHPSAKPTYDFYDTVNAGKTAVGNGILVSSQPVSDPRFPNGATIWHWHMSSPVANYLVENSVGSFDMTQRIGQDGRHYYEFQPSSLSDADKAANLAVMSQQEDITRFQSYFNGPFPFASDGVLIGLPDASFAEEMESMITFPGGTIDLDTFNHENMHQWWGDNVTEANYNLTFFKEGMATVGEYLFGARNAATTAGGLNTAAGRAAFQASLVQQFNDNYARTDLWSGAPSNPTAYTLFDGSSTYDRPGTAYLALRQILGNDRFNRALQQIQRWYGGGVITEPQLEAGFARWLPRPSWSCRSALSTFFTQWFDTDYPTPDGATKPTLTGPGLDGTGFPSRCTAG